MTGPGMKRILVSPCGADTMPDGLVTLTAYVNAYEAHIAKACLEEAGILVFLQDAETAGLYWHMSNAIGGVKLQVPAGDVERAMDILAKAIPEAKKDPNLSSDDSEVSVCLSCGENMPNEVDQCPKCGWTFHCTEE